MRNKRLITSSFKSLQISWTRSAGGTWCYRGWGSCNRSWWCINGHSGCWRACIPNLRSGSSYLREENGTHATVDVAVEDASAVEAARSTPDDLCTYMNKDSAQNWQNEPWALRSATNGSINFLCGSIRHKEVLGKNTAFCITCIVTGVSFAGVVIEVTRGECTSLKSILRVSSHSLYLLREFQRYCLVYTSSVSRSRILVVHQYYSGDFLYMNDTNLMLLYGCNLGVNSFDTGASISYKANFAWVSLQGTIDQSIDLSLNISSRFGISESLVGRGLLKTCSILQHCESLNLKVGAPALP